MYPVRSTRVNMRELMQESGLVSEKKESVAGGGGEIAKVEIPALNLNEGVNLQTAIRKHLRKKLIQLELL